MSMSDQAVPVTLLLPKNLYERVVRAAAYEQRRLEDLLSVLVAEGLDVHATTRELLEHVAVQYRARLAGEGRFPESSDEVLQELGSLREQIARDLYS